MHTNDDDNKAAPLIPTTSVRRNRGVLVGVVHSDVLKGPALDPKNLRAHFEGPIFESEIPDIWTIEHRRSRFDTWMLPLKRLAAKPARSQACRLSRLLLPSHRQSRTTKSTGPNLLESVRAGRAT